MSRWPMFENRPVSPYELGFTQPTARDYEIRRGVNVHHGVWPWSRMAGCAVLMTYGSALSNTFPMIPSEHNMGSDNLHHNYDPPRLPGLSEVIDVLEQEMAEMGVITCVKHKKTSELYQVTQSQWDRMVGRV